MQEPGRRRYSLKDSVETLEHLILIIAILGLVILLLASYIYEVVLRAQAQVVRQQTTCTVKHFALHIKMVRCVPCHTVLVQHFFKVVHKYMAKCWPITESCMLI